MSELDELIAVLDKNADGILSKDELKGFLADMDYTQDETEAMIDAWI